MMRVWSHRPQFSRWALFTAAFVLGCGFAKVLAIVPGSSVTFWPPGGLLMATLMLTPAPSWPWWILGGALAESFGQLVWFSSGLPIGFLIIAGNALAAMLGAWLVNRVCRRPVRLETLREVLAFVVLGAGLAPVVSATVGSATLAWFGAGSQTFWASWLLWWIGDATGILIVAPLTLVVIQNWRGMAQLWATRWIEVSVVGLIFLGVAALSLSGYLPFAYIVMPPLLWVAVRFDVKGAAMTLTLLALITAVFTLSGASQFAGDPESQRNKQIMLHLFLAVSALSALIVAAISRKHQQALLTLRESERSLRELIETAPARIWCFSPHGEPTYWSRQLREFFGFNVDDKDQPGRSRLSTLLRFTSHPDDADNVISLVKQNLVTGEPWMVRRRQQRFDGEYRWVETHAAPMRNADGAIVQWTAVNFDIHDLVVAQEALHRREWELAQLVDMVPSHLWRLTPDGEPTFFNKRMVDFLGLDVADTDKPGMSRLEAVIETVHPDDAAKFRDTLNRCLVTGERFTMRYRLRRADGIYRWMSSRAEPMRDQGGRIVQWYGLCHDINDQVHAEEALREAQDKLARATQAASLSELSASIAHEVNQPLAAIVATSHACHRWLSADPPNLDRAKITLERVIRDAKSASEVVGRVRALFSQIGHARSPGDIAEVISEVCRLMATELMTRNVQIETDFDQGLPPALMDRVQMQQVIINLIRNAIDALETIDGERLIQLRAILDGDNSIRVEVRDLGAGLKEPERIFEPFFTTKKDSMGMGLAICRSIVESHDGRLWATSNQPRGTTLAFTLPIQARDAA
jgi:PAS domain S-box-containing protein